MALRTDVMIKQAGLQEIARDAVKAAGETFSEIDLRNHPFRSLFKFLGPSVLWASGYWMLAVVLGLAEEFLGGGLSTLGNMIDSMLGFGADSTGNVSDSSLKDAAKGALNRLLGITMARSSTFRSSVMRRGHVAVEDVMAAWAAGPDQPIRKEALGKGMLANWWRWLRQAGSGERLPFVAVLYKLLKSLVGGLGLYAGIKFVRKRLQGPEGSSGAGPFGMSGLFGLSPGQKQRLGDPAAGFVEWRNIGGIEQSIIMALDKIVKDGHGRPFSVLFATIRGRPLQGSPAMQRLLSDIQAAYGRTPLSQVENHKYFMAPPPRKMVKMLLPEATYSTQKSKPKVPLSQRTQPVDKADIEKRLGRILGGGKQ